MERPYPVEQVQYSVILASIYIYASGDCPILCPTFDYLLYIQCSERAHDHVYIPT